MQDKPQNHGRQETTPSEPATGVIRGVPMTRKPGLAARMAPLEPEDVQYALFWQGRERRLLG